MSVFAPFGQPMAYVPRLPREFDPRKHRRNLGHLIDLHEHWPMAEFVVDGIALRNRAAVFNPLLGSFSRILRRVVAERVRRSERVLDLGTGSGYLAITAAKRGAHVVATDSDASLAALVEENCARNDVSIDFRAGVADDLFAAIQPRERFDRIIANLPFSRAPLVRDFRESPYYDCFAAPAGLLRALIVDGLPRLAPAGEILFCYGSSGWMDEMEPALEDARGVAATHWMDRTPTRSEWRFVFGVRAVE